jgi:hypothetical protein
LNLDDLPPWVNTKLSVALAGVANGNAWLYSYVTANLSAGTVVTFCTIAIPAIGGAVVYMIKNVWPVASDAYFHHRERLDKLRTSSLSGKLDEVNANLRGERQAREAQRSLAEVAAKRASELDELVKILTAKVDEANAGIKEAKAEAEQSNRRLHLMRNEANRISVQWAADKEELQQQIDAAHRELHEANVQLAQLREQNAELLSQVSNGMLVTKQQADSNTARLDRLETPAVPDYGGPEAGSTS